MIEWVTLLCSRMTAALGKGAEPTGQVCSACALSCQHELNSALPPGQIMTFLCETTSGPNDDLYVKQFLGPKKLNQAGK